jgi:hypothetical protein
MSHTVTIKFAPLLTLDRVNDPAWQRADRTMYASVNALRFLPGKSSAPLIVDHDDNLEIGTVTDLWRLDWIDGPWIAATATLHEPPESWLKRGTRVSFGSKPYGRRAATFTSPEGQVVTDSFIEEVSVLLAMTPAEPLAEVILVKREDSLAAARASNRSAAGEVIYGDGSVIRRYFENVPIRVG